MGLRVGVLGVGKLGRFHALKYVAIKECQLVGVCDLNTERGKAVASELGVRFFDKPENLLAEVDAVSIAASTPAHYRLGKLSLEAGVHVLMEKPLTALIKDGEELVLLANKRQLVLQVGYLERFNGAIKACQDKLKRPLFVDAVRIAPFTEREQDTDVVLDIMSHDINLVLMMDSSAVQDIQATGISLVTNKIDLANARVRFASGCVASFTAGRVATRVERKMRIFQQEFCFSLDFSAPACTMYTLGGAKKDAKKGANKKVQTVVRSLDIRPQDALEVEIRAFVNSVQTKKTLSASTGDGLRTLVVATKIVDIISKNPC